MDSDRWVLEIEPLCSAFVARAIHDRRLTKKDEDAWVSGIAKDVQRNEAASNVARNWLKHVLSSDKRDFCNFVPTLDDETCNLFVRFFWYVSANNGSKARELLREARRNLGLEPQSLYTRPRGERLGPGGDAVLSAPAVLNRLPSTEPSRFEVLAAPTSKQAYSFRIIKPHKLSAALRHKQSVSKNTPSITTNNQRQEVARTSLKKKRKLIPKARSTTRGLSPADDKSESSRSVSEKGVSGASSGYKTRKSARKHFRLSALSSKPHRHITNKLGARARHTHPLRIPKHKRAVDSRTKKEYAQPPKVKSGTTVADFQDQCSVAAPDQAAGSTSAPAPELPSQSVSAPVTGRRKTPPVEANERGSKKTKVAKPSTKERRSSAPSELPVRSSAKRKTSSNLASSGSIAELDRGLAHIGAMAQECHVDGHFGPVYSFDNAAEDIPDDEDDLYDIAMAGRNLYVGQEKEPNAAIFPKQRLPDKCFPLIWAQSRQEVCESFDSFRSFQGGVYHSLDIVKGYLLGGYSSKGDIFHHCGRLIISHGGGKAEALHSKNRGLEVQGPADQLEDDRSVHALLNNYKSGRPLVLLADDNYRLFPFDLSANGYTYVVLGLYWITHAWAEFQWIDGDHGVVRYKFAFQWCEGQGDPWWPHDTEHVPSATQAEVSQDLVHEGQSSDFSRVGQANSQPCVSQHSIQPETTSHHCLRCRMSSLLIYQGTPMCLQPRCPLFFKLDPSTLAAGDSPTSSLSYSAELLRLRPANHLPVSKATYFPSPPSNKASSPSDKDKTPRPFAKGMHCPDCGRLSTRFKWENFECSNCKRPYDAPRFRFNHKDFWLDEQNLKFQHYRIAGDSGIVVKDIEFQKRTKGSALPYIQTFDLPHNRGHVHIIPGHPSINREANEIFGEYQQQANDGKINFRRWPLRSHKCRGQLLSNYFSQNTGAPYQYIGGAERTTPLKDGAPAVLKALRLIQRRIETTLGKHIDFNEVLSAAYMQRQKMAFHSDSERGLGPVVASLSLGCVAEMHFRLHAKYTDPDVPRKVAMTLMLRHGDVLVMEGTGVQEYYEHAVVPKNFRIVATARCISPENYTTSCNDGLKDGHS